MPKLSKPIQWTLILSIFAGVVVFLLPDKPATTNHPKAKRTTTQRTDADGITYADLNTHFPAYKASARDPFVPLISVAAPVTSVRPSALPRVGILPGLPSGWTLTGINTVDGVTTALVENSATNGSVFLHDGDPWQGMTVKSIDPDGVLLINGLGQPVRLSFPTTAPETTVGDAAPPGSPSIGSVTPLAPMPLAGNNRRGRRRGVLPDSSPATAATPESFSQQ